MPVLENSQIEIVRPASAARVRKVLFDFDGTVSLIRSGWEQVMVPMMVEVLAALNTGESKELLHSIALDFVTRLTGKQTVYQMIELAEQVRRRGGTPREPLVYKRMYHDRLWVHIRERVEGLRNGSISAESMLVPGTLPLLEALRERGLELWLASGTDEVFMAEEAALLGVTRFFDGGVRGAQDDYQSFSKRILIQRMIAEQGLEPGELLAFGDGYVEIENTCEAGGVAVGVATDEPACAAVNEWKRERLIQAGAHVIVPNFLESDRLLAYLFDGHERITLPDVRPRPAEAAATD